MRVWLGLLGTTIFVIAGCGSPVVGSPRACPEGQVLCGDTCHDLDTDPLHCGLCDNACAAGETCSAGVCAADCPEGQILCDGMCVDPLTNRTHCGGCSFGPTDVDGGVPTGASCVGDESCIDGICVCPEGSVDCDGICVLLETDLDNCGACGNACPVPPNATATCADSTCGFVCIPGFADCDLDPANGCEVDLGSDIANCGACGNLCADVPNGSAACSAGLCEFACVPDFGDCDLDTSNGCETDLTSTLEHCGMCGMLCPTPPNATPSCSMSVCDFTCLPGFADCDLDPANGCEVDLNTSDMHCGMCGNMCTAPSMCTGGVCGGICRSAPPRILIYGPGLTRGTGLLDPAAVVTTLASDAMWRSMTTADFASYDIIWIGGGNCGGNLDTIQGTADDTVSTWGPAVTGRIVIVTGDPDLHGGAAAQRFLRNSAAWLGVNGATAEGGSTSLFFSWGCTLVNAPGYTAGARGTPERFGSVLGTPITGTNTNFCAAFTTPVGSAHPVLAGITGYWGCPTHGGLPTVPATYDVLATGSAGGTATIVAREAPIPCLTP